MNEIYNGIYYSMTKEATLAGGLWSAVRHPFKNISTGWNLVKDPIGTMNRVTTDGKIVNFFKQKGLSDSGIKNVGRVSGALNMALPLGIYGGLGYGGYRILSKPY